MAGGTFDEAVGKIRPGTYVNFKSDKTSVTGTGDRGTTVVPISMPTYGPAKEWIQISSGSVDSASAKLGYSVYDDDPNRQMLLIREALKGAATVYVYIAAEGTKASADITMTSASNSSEDAEEGTSSEAGTLTATAKYGGSRGNDLTVTIEEDSLSGCNVTVSLGGSKVAYYEQIQTVEELIEQDCAYITFVGSGNLGPNAGVNLTGGKDAEVSNGDITAFLDDLEGIRFNTVCVPSTDSSIQAAAKSKVQYMRENMGRGVQFVVPDFNGDYEGIINVTNSVKIDDTELTHAEACAWVAGATAGATYTQSLTYTTYEGATEVVDPKTHEQAVAAIKNGEFFFSISEAGNVVVEYDINSLVTITDNKGSDYNKNRVIRVLDSFQDSLQSNFPPNKYDNDSTGWDIMEGMGQTILKLYEDAGAITDVDYSSDFLVDREKSGGDQTYFNVGIQPVDSSEKLYFTVKTR